ncbi:hypothetical protein HK105_203156 [Polyrhizophydium stewartii]|uniref:Uncharacterized protein n=1 Tax=Polyrhizophydium stewartii TaxID=2732419 RepID=A0ABR4NC43_9FUNG
MAQRRDARGAHGGQHARGRALSVDPHLVAQDFFRGQRIPFIEQWQGRTRPLLMEPVLNVENLKSTRTMHGGGTQHPPLLYPAWWGHEEHAAPEHTTHARRGAGAGSSASHASGGVRSVTLAGGDMAGRRTDARQREAWAPIPYAPFPKRVVDEATQTDSEGYAAHVAASAATQTGSIMSFDSSADDSFVSSRPASKYMWTDHAVWEQPTRDAGVAATAADGPHRSGRPAGMHGRREHAQRPASPVHQEVPPQPPPPQPHPHPQPQPQPQTAAPPTRRRVNRIRPRRHTIEVAAPAPAPPPAPRPPPVSYTILFDKTPAGLRQFQQQFQQQQQQQRDTESPGHGQEPFVLRAAAPDPRAARGGLDAFMDTTATADSDLSSFSGPATGVRGARTRDAAVSPSPGNLLSPSMLTSQPAAAFGVHGDVASPFGPRPASGHAASLGPEGSSAGAVVATDLGVVDSAGNLRPRASVQSRRSQASMRASAADGAASPSIASHRDGSTHTVRASAPSRREWARNDAGAGAAVAAAVTATAAPAQPGVDLGDFSVDRARGSGNDAGADVKQRRPHSMLDDTSLLDQTHIHDDGDDGDQTRSRLFGDGRGEESADIVSGVPQRMQGDSARTRVEQVAGETMFIVPHVRSPARAGHSFAEAAGGGSVSSRLASAGHGTPASGARQRSASPASRAGTPSHAGPAFKHEMPRRHAPLSSSRAAAAGSVDKAPAVEIHAKDTPRSAVASARKSRKAPAAMRGRAQGIDSPSDVSAALDRSMSEASTASSTDARNAMRERRRELRLLVAQARAQRQQQQQQQQRPAAAVAMERSNTEKSFLSTSSPSVILEAADQGVMQMVDAFLASSFIDCLDLSLVDDEAAVGADSLFDDGVLGAGTPGGGGAGGRGDEEDDGENAVPAGP